jgi:hypothetical protein
MLVDHGRQEGVRDGKDMVQVDPVELVPELGVGVDDLAKQATWSASRTSVTTAIADPPAAVIPSAVCSARSVSMSAITT